jgi:GFO/IDH/MocA oxidoreductase family protein
MSALEAVLVGAGSRGLRTVGVYAKAAPDELKFIAVAEPDDERREVFAREHNIPKENCFKDYKDLLSKPRMAPLCFNTTMDQEHFDSTMMAFDKGYHLFLEKPITDAPETGIKIVQTALEKKLMVQVCHPLRYSSFYLKIKELLEGGAIGRLVSISMEEMVGYWHYAHSFVRGNWRNSKTSGPLIVTKCCHDMDLVSWLVNNRVKKVASFGSRSYFNEANAPEGAPLRCTDGCPAEDKCIYSAKQLYLTDYTGWPVTAISVKQDEVSRRKALETGPYGKCVFRGENDVVDHQVLNAEFEGGVTFNFAVRAFNCVFGRTISVHGTEGEMNGFLDKAQINLYRYTQGFNKTIEPESVSLGENLDGHGGGDPEVIRNFLQKYRDKDFRSIEDSLRNSLEGHLLSFAAESARVKGETILMDEFRESVM